MGTISAWLASQGVSLVLGFLANVLSQAWNSYQANQAQRQLGTVTAERDEAVAGRAAESRIADALANAPATIDAAADRFEKGSA